MGPPIPNVKRSALTLHINKQHETQQVVVIYLCIYIHMCNKEKEAIKSEETPRGMGLREGIQEERKVGRGILHFLKSLINCCSVNILLRGYHFMPAPLPLQYSWALHSPFLWFPWSRFSHLYELTLCVLCHLGSPWLGPALTILLMLIFWLLPS